MEQLTILVEVAWTRLLRLFNVRKNTSYIPKGHYCYEYDVERNKNEPFDGYWIKPCKYFRSTKYGEGCTYIGFFGFDICLSDQCKICDINKEHDSNSSKRTRTPILRRRIK